MCLLGQLTADSNANQKAKVAISRKSIGWHQCRLRKRRWRLLGCLSRAKLLYADVILDKQSINGETSRSLDPHALFLVTGKPGAPLGACVCGKL